MVHRQQFRPGETGKSPKTPLNHIKVQEGGKLSGLPKIDPDKPCQSFANESQNYLTSNPQLTSKSCLNIPDLACADPRENRVRQSAPPTTRAKRFLEKSACSNGDSKKKARSQSGHLANKILEINGNKSDVDPHNSSPEERKREKSDVPHATMTPVSAGWCHKPRLPKVDMSKSTNLGAVQTYSKNAEASSDEGQVPTYDNSKYPKHHVRFDDSMAHHKDLELGPIEVSGLEDSILRSSRPNDEDAQVNVETDDEMQDRPPEYFLYEDSTQKQVKK